MSTHFFHKAWLGVLLVVLVGVWLSALLLLVKLVLILHDMVTFFIEIARLG